MEKAYIALKYYEDFRNRYIVDSIEKALNKLNVKGSCIIRDFKYERKEAYTPKELMDITFSEIDRSDFIIIEYTEKGVGLGIEAGYAYANGKPIIILAKEKSDISNTILGIVDIVQFYNDINDIEGKVVASVTEIGKRFLTTASTL